VNYSQVSISNLALGRIGARGQLVSINDNSPNAIKVLAVWDSIFQEVLSERDWKFAKTRAQLQLSPVTPLYHYKFAWALPQDFLRFVRPHKRPSNRGFVWMWGPEGNGWYNHSDPPFWPHGWTYVVETLTAGWQLAPPAPPVPYPPPFPSGRYLLTNYGGWDAPPAINYIQLITDYTQLMPGFVNCLANRLAMELAIGITEDKNKFQLMEERYKDSLNSAEAQNETMDYEHDEAGSDSWERAGRYMRWF
jgi:hypothetical protein